MAEIDLEKCCQNYVVCRQEASNKHSNNNNHNNNLSSAVKRQSLYANLQSAGANSLCLCLPPSVRHAVCLSVCLSVNNETMTD